MYPSIIFGKIQVLKPLCCFPTSCFLDPRGDRVNFPILMGLVIQSPATIDNKPSWNGDHIMTINTNPKFSVCINDMVHRQNYFGIMSLNRGA